MTKVELNKYPEPFNPDARPGMFKRGDRVIDRHGAKGTILGTEDFDGYDYNRPGEKWELVAFDNAPGVETGKQLEGWVGNIWLKLQ